jgi:hypothetical protein
VISAQMLAVNLRLLLSRSLSLRLYVSLTPEGRALEPGGWYAPTALAPSDWTLAPGSPAIAQSNLREFRFDGSQRSKVLGISVEDVDGVRFVKEFDRPIEVGRRGDIIPVRLVVRLAPIS